MLKSPKIAQDIGAVVIGFSVHDLIYAPWDERMAAFSLEGGEFGFLKGAAVVLVCLVVIGLIFVEAIAAKGFERAGNPVGHDEMTKKLGFDTKGVTNLTFWAWLILISLIYFGFGSKTAFSFGVGVLIYEAQPYLDDFTAKMAEKLN